MRVLFFGHYDADYSRSRILIKGLKKNGVEIVQCNEKGLLPIRYPKLIIKALKLLKRTDIIYVGFPGHTDVPLAWLLGKISGKKVVFDAFISVYDTNIFDRKYFSLTSLRAKYYFAIDWLATHLADLNVFDTNQDKDYFMDTFFLAENKCTVIPVGTDEEIFKPRPPAKHNKLIVGFHGSFLPLQGVEYIIKAAKLLENENIEFRLLGDGMEYQKCRELVKKMAVKNITFLPRVPYEKLPEFIAGIDIYLGGPFGTSSKAGRVIPNKVYEAMAMRKPVIVARSVAIREVFTDKKNAILVERGSAVELSLAITTLEKNISLSNRIATNAFNLFRTNFTCELMGNLLKTRLLKC